MYRMNKYAILPGVHLFVGHVYIEYNESHDLGWRIRVTKIALCCNIHPALQRVSKYANPAQASTQ